MRTSSILKTFRRCADIKKTPHRTFMNVSVKSLPLKNNRAQFGKEIIFSTQPFPNEKKEDFKLRAKKQAEDNIIIPNHLLVMSCPARIAKPEETLRNAANKMGSKKLAATNLSDAEYIVTPGHCLLALINNDGKIKLEQTFSLRPDMSKPVLYRTITAPDKRLPAQFTLSPTIVRPSIHTTLGQELTAWADTAFYTHHVHFNRPIYPLHCLLKPINGRNTYHSAIQEMKISCNRYSLLDHFKPDTGTAAEIISGQNCTAIFRLIEKMFSLNLQNLLGDNPTPQLINQIIKEIFFHVSNSAIRNSGELIEDTDDELNQRYKR